MTGMVRICQSVRGALAGDAPDGILTEPLLRFVLRCSPDLPGNRVTVNIVHSTMTAERRALLATQRSLPR